MEEKTEEKKFTSKPSLIHRILTLGNLFSGIMLIILASAIWIFGFATKPVFFTDGKFVQLVDIRPPATPVVVENTVTKTIMLAKDKEKEIQKIAFCLQSLQPRLSIEVAQIIAKHTFKECNERGIQIPMWIALMFSESSLDPMRSSNMGAHGLCQVRYSTWREQPELLENGVSVRDKLFWIDLNIKCGTTIFKKFYEESGRKVGVALWRYNSGQTKLPEGKKAYDIDYVAKIMYYTYKVAEILAQEEGTLHTISDAEVLAESVVAPAAPAPEVKDKTKKPVVKHD
jgi:hypothetical protein